MSLYCIHNQKFREAKAPIPLAEAQNISNIYALRDACLKPFHLKQKKTSKTSTGCKYLCE
ncbi:hypothetical protein BpHYR1_029356 [Brachionus plicatilis]|uniref:Uncharacterized protein n=1 Tax=Brachionus plicatilis TaxID=10195 RepID=A0A3M7RQB0_BRAPC|nr:hypothetical protein BpHYR1_029356 [Brachionus plicatilis]